MRTVKNLLPIIGALLIVWLVVGCVGAQPAPTATPTRVPAPAISPTLSIPSQSVANFTGDWQATTFDFSLDLSQNGNHLQGTHVAIAQRGNRIDSMNNSIQGTVQGNTAVVRFQSSYTANPGTAQITWIDQNTIVWKITTAPAGEHYLPSEATLVKKTRAAAPSPAPSGTISGRVHLSAPPTPRMVVYAVDPTTGAWAVTKTEPTNGEAPFNLAVPPGSYQIFGAVENGTVISVGYSNDGWALSTVAVAAGQTVSGIVVRPPSQSECGATFGFPASPDGRYAAVAGPKPDCIAAVKTRAAATAQPQTKPQPTRIRFQPNATSWQVTQPLAPNSSNRYVLTAQKGQVMTVELTAKPAPTTGTAASVNIVGADGNVLTPEPTTRYKGILTASQDYFIEIRSLAKTNITYTLGVTIPALSSTPYVPVTPAVCQTLADSATGAIAAKFSMQPSAPFTDPITGETGKACVLTAQGTGRDFTDPVTVRRKLVAGLVGFTEQKAYQADGPTGTMTAVTRDLSVVLISVEWAPDPKVKCPADKPISACDLKPEQKLYTIKLQAAMK